MFPLQENQVLTLMDVEIDWCRQHRDIPEAEWVLNLHESVRRSGETSRLHDELRDATIALRKIHPRPHAIIDKFFAWVVRNPKTGMEGIPGFVEDGIVNLMLACDMEHVRYLRSKANEVESGLGMKLTLFRFDVDRVILDSDIPNLSSANLATKTVQEIFAYVGPAPSGDETVIGIQTSAGGMPLAHADADEIKRFYSAVNMIKKAGQRVELRRFIKTGTVEGFH